MRRQPRRVPQHRPTTPNDGRSFRGTVATAPNDGRSFRGTVATAPNDGRSFRRHRGHRPE